MSSPVWPCAPPPPPASLPGRASRCRSPAGRSASRTPRPRSRRRSRGGRRRAGSGSRRAHRGPGGSSLPGGRTRGRRRSARAGRRGSGLRFSQRDGLLEENGRALELRLLLVGGVEVADRALARPLARQEQNANERRFLLSPTRWPPPDRRRPRTTTRRRCRYARPCLERSSARRAAAGESRGQGARAGARLRPAESRRDRSGAATCPARDPRRASRPRPAPRRGQRRSAPGSSRGRTRRGSRPSSRHPRDAPRRRGSMEVLAAVDDHRLAGDEVRRRVNTERPQRRRRPRAAGLAGSCGPRPRLLAASRSPPGAP